MRHEKAKPGARFAVVELDPYGESIVFWQGGNDAFEAWAARLGYNHPDPVLLQLSEDGTTYGPVDEGLDDRMRDYLEKHYDR